MTIGILVVQDVVAVIFITLTHDEPPSWWAIGLVLLVPFAWVIYRLMDRINHGELLMIFGVVCALAPGYALFETVGLDGDLGAIIIGIIVGQHAKANELSQGLLSIKDLLLVGFFISIGYTTTGIPSLGHIGIAIFLVLLAPLQGLGYALLLRQQGMRTRTASLAGLALANHSEFGLIVTAIGVEAGLLDDEWLLVMSIAVATSFLVSTLVNEYTFEISGWLADRIPSLPVERLVKDDRPIDIGHADVIILGLGRVGKGAYRRFRDVYHLRPIGVEIDPRRVAALKAKGVDVIEGDATDPMFWERCKEHPEIRAAVLAMPFHGANVSALKQLHARGFAGTTTAIARWDDELDDLSAAGADTSIQIYDGAGLELADEAAATAGISVPSPSSPSPSAPAPQDTPEENPPEQPRGQL